MFLCLVVDSGGFPAGEPPRRCHHPGGAGLFFPHVKVLFAVLEGLG